MSATTKPEVLRSDEQPLAHYRSVAPLAVVAVILGVASSLILTTPLLAPLPVAGLIVGIATIPGGFAAKWIVQRIPIRVHATIIEGVVVLGAILFVRKALVG